MTDRPIIFSAPMIKALLAGRKTQTRRLLRLPKWASTDPGDIEFGSTGPEVICRDTGCLAAVPLRFAVGDRLWVKENWHAPVIWDAVRPSELPQTVDLFYSADTGEPGWTGRTRPSIHMPRWASRLTLHVTKLRVERLQDISEQDALREGMTFPDGMRWGSHPQDAFRGLWNSLHGPESWSANPWVVALTFKVEQANIDAARNRDGVSL